VFIGWQRHASRWKGIALAQCQYALRTNKKTKKPYALKVGVPTRIITDLEIRREAWYDAPFKNIGLTVEAQIQKSRFDDTFYLICEDERVLRQMRAKPEIAAQLQSLLGPGVPAGFAFKRLVCRAGLLTVEFTIADGHTDPLAMVAWLSPKLREIEAYLQFPGLGAAPGHDRNFLRSVMILAVSGGLALNGSLQLFRMNLGTMPFTLDLAKLLFFALVGPALVLALLVAATVLVLGRTSAAPLVLLESVLWGGLGAVSTCFVELRDLNIEADTSDVQTFSTQVLERHKSRRRRSTSYSLVLSDWNGGAGTRRVSVDQDTYEHTQLFRNLAVRQHEGALGIRWVASLQ